MHLELGDLPTWVASIGTVATLMVALWQIGIERNRRIAQEKEDREEARLAQARLVSIILGPEIRGEGGNRTDGKTAADLINSSLEPVYGLVIGIVWIQGA